MSANKFLLRGSGIEITYTIGANPALPALFYRAGAFQRSYKAAEVTIEDTGLGHMVSVALIQGIDTGGERFGFFLPLIGDKRGALVYFHSIGIFELFSGPDSIPHRPSTWRCIELEGSAESVIVPL